MTLRKVTPEDLETLTDLGIRSKASWGYTKEQMSVFREELMWTQDLLSSRRVYLAYDKGAIRGYYSLKPANRTTVELEHLFVDPEYFGQGVGTRLFQHAGHTAAQFGYRRMTILSDPNAAEFYDRMHCKRVDDTPSSIAGRCIPTYILDLTILVKSSESPADLNA